MNRWRQIIVFILASQLQILPLIASETLLIQSTTSTKNSGFFDYILPIIKKETGISANIVAVGTGAAINNARNCNGDLLIVHARDREETFVKDGFGIKRFDLMYNDFVIVGPKSDPAKIKKSKTIEVVLRKIATGRHKFASRGDDSGTNIRELALWSFSRINPQNSSGQWYLEMGSGMGATLNAGIELRAYVLTDRATWTTFKNKQNYEILFEGDNKLFNQYGAITINPAICPDVKASEANKIIDWLVSRKGQSVIGELRIDGQQLFFPGN